MQKNINIEDIRTDYRLLELDEKQVDKNPLIQFSTWFEQAVQANLEEVNAMTLATVDPNGMPNARIVLLKDLEDNGFIFYTNYESNKGHELAANPKAALVFFWPALQRQVRINGFVEKVNTETAENYFQSRPIGSQFGAWASPQSQVITDRKVLEANLQSVVEKYKDQTIPKPPHWGGYKVIPTLIEFWQGRTSRLHDRILYTKVGDKWKIERLAP
ncbi:MAG TPA: pyridoxamine 5'-phosphate oxidase [Pseudosphingobacterium sp.]|nr:pyridoxamine 5'-phosphate oxidase [Pseudosphingobacterium sp.]